MDVTQYFFRQAFFKALRPFPFVVAIINAGLAVALAYQDELLVAERGVLVFWLIGMLMVGGGYLAITGGWPISVWLLSVPVSLLTGLLLLSNGIRDLDIDRSAKIYTLAGRLGMASSRRLFQGLIALSYLCAFGLYVMGFLQQIIPIFFQRIIVAMVARLFSY
ncbi:MAG: UbiA family prenyltransferase [Motiliproteus sp.]